MCVVRGEGEELGACGGVRVCRGVCLCLLWGGVCKVWVVHVGVLFTLRVKVHEYVGLA